MNSKRRSRAEGTSAGLSLPDSEGASSEDASSEGTGGFLLGPSQSFFSSSCRIFVLFLLIAFVAPDKASKAGKAGKDSRDRPCLRSATSSCVTSAGISRSSCAPDSSMGAFRISLGDSQDHWCFSCSNGVSCRESKRFRGRLRGGRPCCLLTADREQFTFVEESTIALRQALSENFLIRKEPRWDRVFARVLEPRPHRASEDRNDEADSRQGEGKARCSKACCLKACCSRAWCSRASAESPLSGSFSGAAESLDGGMLSLPALAQPG